MSKEENKHIFEGMVEIGEEANAAGDEELVEHIRNNLQVLQEEICKEDPKDEICPPEKKQ